jgi:hypothetical protein
VIGLTKYRLGLAHAGALREHVTLQSGVDDALVPIPAKALVEHSQ